MGKAANMDRTLHPHNEITKMLQVLHCKYRPIYCDFNILEIQSTLAHCFCWVTAIPGIRWPRSRNTLWLTSDLSPWIDLPLDWPLTSLGIDLWLLPWDWPTPELTSQPLRWDGPCSGMTSDLALGLTSELSPTIDLPWDWPLTIPWE